MTATWQSGDAPLLWPAKAGSWVSSLAWDPSSQPCFPPARAPPLRSACYPLPTLGICLFSMSLSQRNRIHRLLVLDPLLQTRPKPAPLSI